MSLFLFYFKQDSITVIYQTMHNTNNVSMYSRQTTMHNQSHISSVWKHRLWYSPNDSVHHHLGAKLYATPNCQDRQSKSKSGSVRRCCRRCVWSTSNKHWHTARHTYVLSIMSFAIQGCTNNQSNWPDAQVRSNNHRNSKQQTNKTEWEI